MPSFRTGTVTSIIDERRGLQRVEVDGEHAYVLTELIGPVAVGDRVVMNTTAVELGLGTGGWHIVHWNLTREDWSAPGGGHQMKLRYTSLQADTGAAEEPTDGDEDAPTGVPVVVCGLHSQVGVVAVVVRDALPHARIAYVMTDAAALPLAMSELVLALRNAGILDMTITAGQAFGGDVEAVNTASGIDLAARRAADVIIVGMGPGSLGTGTTYGFSGLEVGPIIDAAAALGHRPVVAVRYSSADPRERHLGLSHHTKTALTQFAHARAAVPIPRGQPRPDVGHDIVEIDTPDVAGLLRRMDIEITTMGRGPEPDPDFFDYAAAAGVYAADLVRAGHHDLDEESADGSESPPAGDPPTPGQVVASWATGAVTTPVEPPEPEPAPPEPDPEPPADADPAPATESSEPVTVAEIDEPEPSEGTAAGALDAGAEEDGAGTDATSEADEPRRRRRPRSSTRNAIEWALIVVGALLAAFVIKTFFVQAFYIPSASMDPTLEIGDRVLVNKLSYKLHDVHRGDVVVFERPPGAVDQPEIKDLIKRVIGLPGETIESKDGDIFINNRRLDEPYLSDDILTQGVSRQKIPKDHYWVMGDNRGASRDSRSFAAIPEDTIVGRAFVRVWPFGSFGLL